jgi:hypothetical protein
MTIVPGPDVGDAQQTPLMPAVQRPAQRQESSDQSRITPHFQDRLFDHVGIEPEARYGEIGEVLLLSCLAVVFRRPWNRRTSPAANEIAKQCEEPLDYRGVEKTLTILRDRHVSLASRAVKCLTRRERVRTGAGLAN